MRILVTNDDGINAPGIKVLEEVARSFSDDVIVVAPEVNQSGAGHSLTLRRPLRIRHIDDAHFAVDGTPTDCVMLAVHQILRERPVDWVFSGINFGGNLAEDLTSSGTVAAAMEATLLGIKAVAFSQCFRERGGVPWDTARQWCPRVFAAVRDMPWTPGVLLNANIPACEAGEVAGIAATRQGRRDPGENLVERIDPRGEPYVWIGALRGEANLVAGTDIAAVHDRLVSLTPVHLDMTHGDSMANLQELLQS